ncbi:MAG TPA: T9SS type A sorting domain-containing protein [Ignavibacteriaceae bacterium]
MYKKFLISLLVLLSIVSGTAFCQWVETNGPNVNDVQCIFKQDNHLVVGTLASTSGGPGGAYFSNDDGDTWTEMNFGLTFHDIEVLAHFGTNLFAGVYNGGVFVSADNDTNWIAYNDNLTAPYVESLAIQGSYIFAGTWGGGVWRSSYNTANWIPIYAVPGSPDVRCFVVSGNNLFAGTSAGVYLTTNSGADWVQRSSGLTGDVRTMVVSGTNLFAGTFSNGVFFSNDDGVSWTEVNNGLTNHTVAALAVSGTNVFAGTYGDGTFLTTDNGANWTSINSGLFNKNVRSLAVYDSTIYAGTYKTQNFDGEVWRRPLSEILVGVQDQAGRLPSDFNLAQNYPNPFNPSTMINFSIPREEYVSLLVFNSLGQKVAELVNETEPAGNYSVNFNPGPLASGVYLYELKAGSFIQSKKMMLVK